MPGGGSVGQVGHWRRGTTWRRFAGSLLVAAAVLAGAARGEAWAQQVGTVQGVVSSRAGGSPLPGVQVELLEVDRRTLTDELGRFRFAGVPQGSHTLRFRLIGRSVLERVVQVAGDAARREEVELGQSALPLAPVLVLLDRTRLTGGAGLDRVPGSVQVVGARALEERPVVFDDVHALLREVPGVNVQEEDGYGLRPNIGMRGTGVERSSKIALLEDGVPIAPAPYSAPAAYYFPLAGRMEAIEVRKGSSQIRFGPSTIGGALNMVSSGIPGSFSLLADAATGSDATRKVRVRAGDSRGGIGWMLETYRLQTDGFKRLDDGGPTGFDVQDYVAKVRVSSDLDAPVYQELELKLGYYEERSDETYLGLTEADFARTPRRRYAGSQEDVMRADHRQIQLRHFLHLADGLDVTTTAYRNEFTRGWFKLASVAGTSISAVLDDPATHANELAILTGEADANGDLVVRANNRDYVSTGIQSALGLGFWAGGEHELELGFRYHEDEEDRFQHDDGFAIRGGRMALVSPGEPGTQANRVSDAQALAFYVQDRINLGRLTVTPGLRYETIDFTRRDYEPGDAGRRSPAGVRENSVSAWIPGVGASFDAQSDVQLFAGVHRGFGPPGPGADEETEAESSVNYELGGRLTRAGLSAQAVGFYSDYGNILGAATLSSGEDDSGDVFNGGDVSVVGLEVSAAYDALAEQSDVWRLPLQVGYTLTRATFETAFESNYGPWGTVEDGDELPYLPRHQFFGRAGLERDAWALELTANTTSAMRTVAGQGEIPEGTGTEAYVVFGLGGRYQLPGGTTVYGAVQNLTDETHAVARRPAGLRPGLPRTLELGLRVSR